IELTYDNDQPINFIEIYETFNSGTIDTVYVKNPGTNAFEVVYTGSAELYNQPLQNRITFPLTTFAVSTIRIAINSVDLPAQKSIDAVGIGIASNDTYKWSDGSTGDILLVNKSGQYVLTATNEDGCSVSDTINLVMQDPIKPVIVAGGETALCTGGSVTLQAPIGFATYKWSNGATTPSITINQGGSYSVTVTTENGCKSVASDAVTVTVKPALSAPTVVVTNNCGSATLRATGSGTFLWSNGATTASITVNNPGTYSVTQTVDGCTSIPASAIAAPKEAPAKPVITASGATTFYTGGSVTLHAPIGFATYKWSNGATTPSITVLQSGSYSVQVTNGSGCTSVASNPVVVTVNPLPSALYVSHLDGDNGQTANNNIRPYLQLHNEGPTTIPYKDVTIRYWLTVEEFAPMTNLFVDYAQLGTARVKMKYVKLGQPRQGAYGYIEYSFDASAGTLAPGKNSGPIQSRAAKSDWTLFNETNDYSYAPGKTYTRNNKITVYQNGVLVGGTEPAAIPVVQKLKASSQDKSGKTSTNAIQQWLQVTNEGNTPVNYKDLTVRYWFTADGNKALNYALDYTPLGNSAVNYRFQKLATPLSGADTYLELSFNVADSLYPASATGTIQQRFYKSDWSLFSQGNDHSYQANKILAENVRVTVYLKGQLVYGEEPSAFTTLHQSQNQPPATAIGDNGTTAGSLDLAVLGNPVTGQVLNFLVKGGENKQVQVTLADAQGRVLARKSLAQPSAASQQQISVNGMANGILFLSVTTPQEKKTLPVLINH
ncbi:MAG: T9SS type A sorting domain-containing protein, partial [Chitinophagaceae bacterium]